MNSTDTFAITVPLPREAHAIASEFAAEQATPQKGKKVYLNTLAVYAVHSYLKWLEIDTDLSQSNSWNPGLRELADVCDLLIPGIGFLECCPVLPGETTFMLSSEISKTCIGMVAVQFRDRLDEVQLLGFASTVNSRRITDLQPLDAIFDHLNPLVDLSQWFENLFEASWQSVEAISSQITATACAFGSSITAQKLFDLENIGSFTPVAAGWRSAKFPPVALLITLAKEEDEKTAICLQLNPTDGEKCLPPNLKLIVQDESGNSLVKETDTETLFIEIKEMGDRPGYRFHVTIALGDVSFTETFVI